MQPHANGSKQLDLFSVPFRSLVVPRHRLRFAFGIGANQVALGHRTVTACGQFQPALCAVKLGSEPLGSSSNSVSGTCVLSVRTVPSIPTPSVQCLSCCA